MTKDGATGECEAVISEILFAVSKFVNISIG